MTVPGGPPPQDTVAGNGRHSYDIPLSFGYGGGQHRCIFQSVSVEGSRKERFLKPTETTTLKVYSYPDKDGSWRSAIASGPIVQLSDKAVSNRATAIIFRRAADTAAPSANPLETGSERRWDALDFDSLSGRVTEAPPDH